MGWTRRVDFGRVFACVFVVGAHLVFWWVLTRKIVLPVPAGDADDALQVTWIEPPPAPVPPPPVAAGRPDAQPPSPRRLQPVPVEPADPAVDDAAAPSDRARLGAVFLEQGRQLSRARIDADAFAADPLAHRAAKLPGPGRDRFRMREPVSPERMLRAVGALLAGPGYTTDPCPRVAENIDRLSQEGDSELLQEELRRKRALCD